VVGYIDNLHSALLKKFYTAYVFVSSSEVGILSCNAIWPEGGDSMFLANAGIYLQVRTR
jgi:hypothetical protein